jgi:predicted TIM-barrel fold metal-dependent hydrolase
MDATSIYSCDDHIDLHHLRPDLWSSRLPKAFAERGPHVETIDGVLRWVCDKKVIGFPMAPGNDEDRYRPSNPTIRLEDMDQDGIWASVIYGPVPLHMSIDDAELEQACFAVWNDWAAQEFNSVAPDRLCVLPFLPTHSPEAAAAELERCAAKGHRGAIIDVFDFDATDPAWDRLWAAAHETGLPLSFHIKGGSSLRLSFEIGKWQSAAFASLLPMQLNEAIAIMIFSGALARHPGFKLVLAEAGIGWLPYYLSRMDMEWKKLKDMVDYAPKDPPSELFRRQVIATFEEEEAAPQVIPQLGFDVVMWASDYPHLDSTFPESRRVIAETFGSFSLEDRRKVTALNCARLYGFDYVA